MLFNTHKQEMILFGTQKVLTFSKINKAGEIILTADFVEGNVVHFEPQKLIS